MSKKRELTYEELTRPAPPEDLPPFPPEESGFARCIGITPQAEGTFQLPTFSIKKVTNVIELTHIQ
jgi:hypothetical protein